MCGIFGLVVNNKSNISQLLKKKLFTNLFLSSESRGKEASGFAFHNGKEIVVYKAPHAASSVVRSRKFKDTSKYFFANAIEICAAIGHSRLVTNGPEQFNVNNQPIIKNNMVGVHNGIIVNQDDLWRNIGSNLRLSELDSELIPTLIQHYFNISNNLKVSIKKTFEAIFGMTSIAFMFSEMNNILLATNNGSLYYQLSQQGDVFIFASEKAILHKLQKEKAFQKEFKSEGIIHLAAGEMIFIDMESGSIETALIDKNFSEGDFNYKRLSDKRSKITEISDSEKDNSYHNTSLFHFKTDIPSEFISNYNKCAERISRLRRCTKCLLPDTFPFIEFNDQGVCNYCTNYKMHEIQGEKKLEEIVSGFRSSQGKQDCLIPFSGGRDSCYTLHYIKTELKLNPIAFSYDWGMITDLARRNQARLCGKLGVEHILVSADIRKKRKNIRANVIAWLKKPNLGTVPLFMAGDKQYFYYANLLMRENKIDLSILGENMFETTNFKSGFCGIRPRFGEDHTYSLSAVDKMKLAKYYGIEFIKNPAYLNNSLADTIEAFKSYYIIRHRNLNIYDFIKWDEAKIISTLRTEYDWEIDPGTKTTWRIGDGTAAFYNYIYYILAGFTENDTFRSNQIREGELSRDVALNLVLEENQPRFESIRWYCDTIQIDFENTIRVINKAGSLY